MSTVDFARFGENVHATLQRWGNASRLFAIRHIHGAELDEGNTEERIKDYLNRDFVRLIDEFQETRRVTERYFVNRNLTLETSSILQFQENEMGRKSFPICRTSVCFRSQDKIDYLLGTTRCVDRNPYLEHVLDINFSAGHSVHMGKREDFSYEQKDKNPIRTIYKVSRNGLRAATETAIIQSDGAMTQRDGEIANLVNQALADFQTAKARLPAPIGDAWNTIQVIHSQKYGHRVRRINPFYAASAG